PAMRSRAAMIASIGIGSCGCIVPAPDVDGEPDPLLDGPSMDELGGGQVLDGEAHASEHGDLLVRRSAGDGADHELAQLTGDVVVADRALVPGDHELAGFVQ